MALVLFSLAQLLEAIIICSQIRSLAFVSFVWLAAWSYLDKASLLAINANMLSNATSLRSPAKTKASSYWALGLLYACFLQVALLKGNKRVRALSMPKILQHNLLCKLSSGKNQGRIENSRYHTYMVLL